MQKIKIIIIRRPTGDNYYGTSELSWAHTFYPSNIQGWKEEPEFFQWKQNHQYWGESISFADAIEIDGQIFIESSALGEQEFHNS